MKAALWPRNIPMILSSLEVMVFLSPILLYESYLMNRRSCCLHNCCPTSSSRPNSQDTGRWFNFLVPLLLMPTYALRCSKQGLTKDVLKHTQPAQFFPSLAKGGDTHNVHIPKPSDKISGRSVPTVAGRCVSGGSAVNCEYIIHPPFILS